MFLAAVRGALVTPLSGFTEPRHAQVLEAGAGAGLGVATGLVRVIYGEKILNK